MKKSRAPEPANLAIGLITLVVLINSVSILLLAVHIY